MFNIGFAELVIVLLVAFLIVGPKDLPKVARWIAKQVKAIRRMIREVKKETGWEEFAAEFKETKEDIDNTLKQADITAELRDASHELQRNVNGIQKDLKKMDKEIKK